MDLEYAFSWLTGGNKMFGQINLEKFTAAKLPQKGASAWSGVNWNELTGIGYKPLVYAGEQEVNGTLHWFIAEATQPYSTEIRHVVKMAILEYKGKYTVEGKSISIIF